jgi:hypothetical protein
MFHGRLRSCADSTHATKAGQLDKRGDEPTCFFALGSAVHLGRIVLRVEVTAFGTGVPIWMSSVACVVTGVLAILLWREGRRP